MALKKSELCSSLGKSCDELRGAMDVTSDRGNGVSDDIASYQAKPSRNTKNDDRLDLF